MDSSVFSTFKVQLQHLDQEHFTSKYLLELFSNLAGGYRYSPPYFSYLLREKLHLYYYKPSPVDYRRCQQAETQLSQRIQATLDALGVLNKDVSQMAIGFADESAVQLHHNNARFWALQPHLPRRINSELGTEKFFGFYALKGESVLAEMQGCKGEDFKPYLQQIKSANADSKGIILFWDNATPHKKVEQWAWQEGIYIIALPPYSPDLNPIERVWKSCKRWVNEQGFCKTVQQLSVLFQKAYDIYKGQASFAAGWCEKMASIFSWNNSSGQEVAVQT